MGYTLWCREQSEGNQSKFLTRMSVSNHCVKADEKEFSGTKGRAHEISSFGGQRPFGNENIKSSLCNKHTFNKGEKKGKVIRYIEGIRI